jgi:trigger factor
VGVRVPSSALKDKTFINKTAQSCDKTQFWRFFQIYLMEIIKEQIDELNAQLKIQLTEADLNPKVEASLADLKKKAQLKGFRPGKVPMGLIKKMYGKAVIYEEMNKLVSENLSSYLKNEELDIIGEPIPTENQETIDLDNAKEFNFSFDLGLRPKFELDLNKKIKIPYYRIAVDDQMIDKQVESFADRFGKLQSTDEVTDKSYLKGSIFQLDENGNILEDGISKEESSILMSQLKDEDTKKELLDKKVDEKIILDAIKAFPSESELSMVLGVKKEELENTSTKFEYTIKEIAEFAKSEINPVLFEKVFPGAEIATEEDFRNKLREQISNSTLKESDYKFMLDAREKILEKSEVPLPEEFLKRWLKLRDDKNEITDEQLDKEFPKILRDLKWQLIVGKLIKDNDLKVEFEEIKELAIDLTELQFNQYYGLPIGSFPREQMEQYATDLFLKKEEEVKKLFDKKYEDKAVEVIREKVKLDEKEISVEEFNKLFSEN